MEERPPIEEAYSRLTKIEKNSGHLLTVLDDQQRQVTRDFYFQRAATYVPDMAGKLFFDKYPLATANVRIIKLLFPNAKILFALRHPCDVVLSCFMQRFQTNAAMANFYTLDEATHAYQLVMNLWQKAYPALNLPVHFIRYEDLVLDFNNQVRSVLNFLNLSWDDRVESFHHHAFKRDLRTTSSRQVTQPLYTSSVARWLKYRRYMEPHVDTLQTFIDAFGYDSSSSQ